MPHPNQNLPKNLIGWAFVIASTIVITITCGNIYLFIQLHSSSPRFLNIDYNDMIEVPQFSAERYKIDPNSPSPSLRDKPKWPPMKIYIYPNDKYHTDECLYPPEMPLRYVNESGYWFQRMLEPTTHHQFLNSPIVTSNPDEADVFYVPHYSRMCSGLDDKKRWNAIPNYLRKNGNYFDRYSSLDHFVMHSVPHYGDKPADFAVELDKAPMVGILDIKLSSMKANPWLTARTTIVPFITLSTDDSSQNDRPISAFVAMSTSTKGLKASSALLRQKIEEQLSNVSNSDIVLINRKSYQTFKKALDSLPRKMKSARFCIVPPGDAPSSKRFYDAISHMCVPFMLADYFFLPYEGAAVEYERCIRQLPARDVDRLAETLNGISKRETEEMRTNLNDVRERFTWNYRMKPKTGQALWSLAWSMFDKIQMLKPYENNEMTGFESDPTFSIEV